MTHPDPDSSGLVASEGKEGSGARLSLVAVGVCDAAPRAAAAAAAAAASLARAGRKARAGAGSSGHRTGCALPLGRGAVDLCGPEIQIKGTLLLLKLLSLQGLDWVVVQRPGRLRVARPSPPPPPPLRSEIDHSLDIASCLDSSPFPPGLSLSLERERERPRGKTTRVCGVLGTGRKCF